MNIFTDELNEKPAEFRKTQNSSAERNGKVRNFPHRRSNFPLTQSPPTFPHQHDGNVDKEGEMFTTFSQFSILFDSFQTGTAHKQRILHTMNSSPLLDIRKEHTI